MLYFGYINGRGKWKIQNDTLILIEKYREKFYGKLLTGISTKLVMQDNTLYKIYSDNGKVSIGSKYITKRQWKRNHRDKKRKTKEQHDRLKKSGAIK